ncbi:MAG: cobalamin-dependent protein, partial [Anaerolineae bacterium]|nr:cobalamin-dependent protein [Anaerolineae bacterium]
MTPPILLFNPQCVTRGKQRLPMSLLAIASVINGDYLPIFIDGNVVDNPAEIIIEKAKATGAKLLGVSTMPGPQLMQAIEVCRQVKAALPQLIIVWGGYFPSHHGDVCVNSGLVDYVIEGQGEAAFRKLVDTLHYGGSLNDVPSLIWQDENQVKTNPRAPLVP